MQRFRVLQNVSAYPSICLNGIPLRKNIFGKRESLTPLKPQNSVLPEIVNVFDDLWSI